jgi:ubiquinone/menaquinone biosynthesis C-methylase UbiE
MSLPSPLYDRIGATYDATRHADPDLSVNLIRLLDRPNGARLLDIGCGTGNYTLALSEAGYGIIGLDRSQRMLGQARQKSGGLALVGGDAAALPFPARRFDGVICTLALHHFADLETSFAEARRVLNGGRLVVFTAFPEQMTHYWLAEYFPRMIDASAEQMPDWPTIEAALRRGGFRTFRQVPYWMTERPRDHFLYCGKHQPALYLDARIRANISSFAALAEAEELATGLDRLRRDIENGEWQRLRRRFGDEQRKQNSR